MPHRSCTAQRKPDEERERERDGEPAKGVVVQNLLMACVSFPSSKAAIDKASVPHAASSNNCMNMSPSTAFTVEQERSVHGDVSLCSCCDKVDLIALVTNRSDLAVYRLNFQRVFECSLFSTIWSLAWSPSGKQIAALLELGVMVLLNVESGHVDSVVDLRSSSLPRIPWDPKRMKQSKPNELSIHSSPSSSLPPQRLPSSSSLFWTWSLTESVRSVAKTGSKYSIDRLLKALDPLLAIDADGSPKLVPGAAADSPAAAQPPSAAPAADPSAVLTASAELPLDVLPSSFPSWSQFSVLAACDGARCSLFVCGSFPILSIAVPSANCSPVTAVSASLTRDMRTLSVVSQSSSTGTLLLHSQDLSPVLHDGQEECHALCIQFATISHILGLLDTVLSFVRKQWLSWRSSFVHELGKFAAVSRDMQTGRPGGHEELGLVDELLSFIATGKPSPALQQYLGSTAPSSAFSKSFRSFTKVLSEDIIPVLEQHVLRLLGHLQLRVKFLKACSVSMEKMSGMFFRLSDSQVLVENWLRDLVETEDWARSTLSLCKEELAEGSVFFEWICMQQGVVEEEATLQQQQSDHASLSRMQAKFFPAVVAYIKDHLMVSRLSRHLAGSSATDVDPSRTLFDRLSHVWERLQPLSRLSAESCLSSSSISSRVLISHPAAAVFLVKASPHLIPRASSARPLMAEGSPSIAAPLQGPLSSPSPSKVAPNAFLIGVRMDGVSYAMMVRSDAMGRLCRLSLQQAFPDSEQLPLPMDVKDAAPFGHDGAMALLAHAATAGEMQFGIASPATAGSDKVWMPLGPPFESVFDALRLATVAPGSSDCGRSVCLIEALCSGAHKSKFPSQSASTSNTEDEPRFVFSLSQSRMIACVAVGDSNAAKRVVFYSLEEEEEEQEADDEADGEGEEGDEEED